MDISRTLQERDKSDICWRMEDYLLDPAVPLSDAKALREFLEEYGEILSTLETPTTHQHWADEVDRLLEQGLIPTVSETEAEEYCSYREWSPREVSWEKVSREVTELRRRSVYLSLVKTALGINLNKPPISMKSPDGANPFLELFQRFGVFLVDEMDDVIPLLKQLKLGENDRSVRQYLFFQLGDIRLRIQSAVRVPHRRIKPRSYGEVLNILSETKREHGFINRITQAYPLNQAGRMSSQLISTLLEELDEPYEQQSIRNILIEKIMGICRLLEKSWVD